MFDIVNIQLYDIAAFYTDAGPIAQWDSAVEERTQHLGSFTKGESFHVIKVGLLLTLL